MGMLLGVTAFVFVLLAIVAAVAYWIDKSAAGQQRPDKQLEREAS